LTRIDDIKNALDEAVAKQAKNSRNPDSADAKRTGRIAGFILLVLGLVSAGTSYYLYANEGLISPLLLGATIAFLGLGVFLVMFGKMPQRRRPRP